MAVGRGAGTRRPGRRAGRGPFAALVMVLLAGGLVALLMLNTALSQDSFTVQKLQRQTTQLTNEQQGLQQQIDGWSAPDALAARARQMGMVPAGNPAFVTDSGKVLGDPSQLPAAPSPLPTPPASPSPSPSGSGSPSPSASGHAPTPHTAGTPTSHTAGTPTSHTAGTPASHTAGTPAAAHAAHPTPSGH
ncbi:cell division protein FtsB [Streptacidiphilus sp. MAP12-33]|uniref:hypothetical protein n=1 Tax=Streptacidiphilus sp. MAP12-33 TaxID=3156266 RepID=UPI003518690D